MIILLAKQRDFWIKIKFFSAVAPFEKNIIVVFQGSRKQNEQGKFSVLIFCRLSRLATSLIIKMLSIQIKKCNLFPPPNWYAHG